MKTTIIAALLLSAGYGADWTNRAEYDLVLSVRAESSSQKRLKLLEEWNERYPQSPQAAARQVLHLETYEALGKPDQMLRVAREMARSSDSPIALYWVTLLAPVVGGGDEPSLLDDEKTVRRLLDGLDRYLGSDRAETPQGEEYQARRRELERLARRTLGWLAVQRRDYRTAEQELTLALLANPADAQLSGWLGMVQLLGKEPGRRSGALWHLARAASSAGSNLTEGDRRQFQSLVTAVYASYHGSTGGLDSLQSTAQSAAIPPAGFVVEPAESVAARKEEERLSQLPSMEAAWLRLRKQLESAGADSFFADSLRGKPLPKLRGTLVSASPERRPSQLVLAVGDSGAGEVRVTVTPPLASQAEPGTIVEFEGTAESFQREPFYLHVSARPNQIGGWPTAQRRTRR
jgi:hypothetical protein